MYTIHADCPHCGKSDATSIRAVDEEGVEIEGSGGLDAVPHPVALKAEEMVAYCEGCKNNYILFRDTNTDTCSMHALPMGV